VTLIDRLEDVETRIERAALRAGRRRSEITLVAITKVFPASVILEAYALGVRRFGENYVQEFEGKVAELSDLAGAEFHFVGHLQSNKARLAVELFQVIETIDSEKIARRINDIGHKREVFVEVKLSAEDAKRGADPDALPALLEAIRSCPNLRLAGLMTMPPWSDNPDDSRPYFRQLRALAERHGLGCLSMGMSQDFEAAIEEGATHVRIGSALFGPRRQP
jgi:PLP dependent protein